MKKKLSIKFKLLFALSISIIVSFIILGLNTLNEEYNIEYKEIKKEEMLISKDGSKYVDSFFQSKIDIFNVAFKEVSSQNWISSENKAMMNGLRILNDAGKFIDIYIGMEKNGHVISVLETLLTPEKDDYEPRTRPWYMDTKKMDKLRITEPYFDETINKLVVSICAPLKIDGKFIGIMGADISIDTVLDTISQIKLKNSGYAYLVNKDSKILVHKNRKFLDKKDDIFKKIKEKEKESSFKEIKVKGVDILTAYSLVPISNWYLVTRLDKKEMTDELMGLFIKTVLIYIILLIIILVVVYFTLKRLLSPLDELQRGLMFFFRYLNGKEKQIQALNINTGDEFDAMAKTLDKEMKLVEKALNEDRLLIEEVKSVVDQVKKGILNVRVQGKTSNNTLSELKNILNEMCVSINKNVNSDINLILEVIEEYSKLDFTDEIKNPDGKVAEGLNNLSKLINGMLKEDKQRGLILNEKAKTLSENVNILNKSSNETAASLEETAAAVEEITSSISNNTNSINQVSEHSQELVKAISKGQSLANSTVTSMDEINEQTQAIAEAITVIDQIAFQTNILSLNAAVEAATAGEAGKGFAVVAGEVRNLANRSAEAAKEIKDLVESATLKTNYGKQIADEMIVGYTKLNEDIEKTTKVINDIAQSSKEQRISIEQINDVVNKLDEQTQKNATVANETQGIAMDTSKIASEILEEVNNKKFRD